ncbi:opioid growth factor receptor conserved region-domain-containing protein [Hypoxylon sp. FL1857]|nr:opioid growth factor receptor conserved region-domain-containing protein [Hypoxylon sp. FL1857]
MSEQSPYSRPDRLPTEPRLRELLLFYHVNGHDEQSPKGSFIDILRLPDEDLEKKHDFIQWLFPLAEESVHNSNAPILDEETVLIFRHHHDDWLRENVKLALQRMMWFYGYDTVWRDGKLETAEIEGPRQKFRWLTPSSHNHLRISRMLKSLRILGMPHEAEVVYDTFRRTNIIWGDGVSDATLEHWKLAADGPYGSSEDAPDWLVNLQEADEVMAADLRDAQAQAPKPLHQIPASAPRPSYRKKGLIFTKTEDGRFATRYIYV